MQKSWCKKLIGLRAKAYSYLIDYSSKDKKDKKEENKCNIIIKQYKNY